MRAIVIVAATLLFCGAVLAKGGNGMGKGLVPVGSSGPEVASQIRLGRVTAIDLTKQTFACHWKTGDHIYQIGSSTNVRIGSNPASMTDLTVGQTVQVMFHISGKTEVADLIVIQ